MSKHFAVIKSATLTVENTKIRLQVIKNIWLFANFLPIYWLSLKEKGQPQLSLGIYKGILKPSE